MKHFLLALMLLCFSVHILVPLHILDLSGQTFFGMSAEIAAIYLSTLAIVIIMMFYFKVILKPMAGRFDKKLDDGDAQ